MTKKIFLCLIFLMISVFICFFSINLQNNKNSQTNNKNLTIDQWEELCFEISKDEDLSFTYINKSDSISTAYSKLNLPNKNNIINVNGPLKLTENKLSEICENNDLYYYSEGDSYLVKNTFELKKLIVIGNVTNTYNAKHYITGYKDYSILKYNSIEETKYAYNELLKDDSINVFPDTVARAVYDDVSTEAKKSSSYNYLSWGANAIDINNYNSYLNSGGNINKDVVVAVLDTGINTSHELFLTKKGNRFLYDENNKIVGHSYYYNKNDQYYYTYSGYEFEDDQWSYNKSGHRESPSGHGTHVSGTIVDLTPENVKILPIKVLNYKGSGDWSYILSAVNRVIDKFSKTYQIAAVNMSLGGSDSTQSQKAHFTEVFDKLLNNNILPIVAAGNKSSDNTVSMDTKDHCPSACENAIVVSALKMENGEMTFDSSYSHYGDEVDIAAPGTAIYSSIIDDSPKTPTTSPHPYNYYQGTSMATPHVSAVVALLCLDITLYDENENPTYTAQQIENKLLNECTSSKSNKRQYGKGILTLSKLKFNVSKFSTTETDTTVNYDGNYHNIGLTVTNASNFQLKYSLDGSNYNITDITKYSTFKNVTNGKITVYYELSKNGYETKYGSKTLEIKPKDVTILIHNQTSTYGNVTFNNKFYTCSELVTGDDLGLTLSTTATSYSSAGDYPIQINNYTNQNYNITNSSTTGTLTINPKHIKIDILNQSFTFGEKINLDNSKCKLDIGQSLVNGDRLSDLNIILSHNAPDTPTVDSGHNIFIESHNNSNYTLESDQGSIIINKKQIEVSLNNITSTYGENIDLSDVAVYNQNDIVAGYPLNLQLKSTATTNASVGTYTISILSYDHNNYNIANLSSTHTITPRIIETSIQYQSFDYSDVNFNSNLYTIDHLNIINNDDLGAELSTLATNNSNIGEYDITLTFNNPNYTPSVQKLENGLTISPKKFEITLTTTSFIYGDPIQQDLFTTTETIENVDISLLVEDQQVVAKTSNSNYKVVITNSAEDITIQPRQIEIRTVQTFTYGDEVVLDNLNFECENVLPEDKENLLTLHCLQQNRLNVGNHNIITYTLNNSNYEVVNFEGIVSIQQKELNVTIKNKVITYGDSLTFTENDFLISQTDLISGDNAHITLSSNGKNVGNYKINAECNNSNYKLKVQQNGILTINKRKLTVKLSNQTVEHSFPIEFDQSAYQIIDGVLLNNDVLNINITADTSLFKQFGTFALYATYDNDNYDITFEKAEVTINVATWEIIALAGICVAILGLIILKIKRRRRY